ncbi:MAG: hypothetical protein IJQ08_03750 [Synergistaceae bacterium]|nr:hypothetical protein [Synergistaceae bacterium]
MGAVTEKKKVWVKPDRKMTMEELWERFEYDPDYVDDDPAYEAAIYDRYGNPTYGTLCALYEEEHDIGETLTVDELFEEWNKIWYEANPEEKLCELPENAAVLSRISSVKAEGDTVIF